MYQGNWADSLLLLVQIFSFFFFLNFLRIIMLRKSTQVTGIIEEDMYSVILKGLPKKMDVQEIRSLLLKDGYRVCQVINRKNLILYKPEGLVKSKTLIPPNKDEEKKTKMYRRNVPKGMAIISFYKMIEREHFLLKYKKTIRRRLKLEKQFELIPGYKVFAEPIELPINLKIENHSLSKIIIYLTRMVEMVISYSFYGLLYVFIKYATNSGKILGY